MEIRPLKRVTVHERTWFSAQTVEWTEGRWREGAGGRERERERERVNGHFHHNNNMLPHVCRRQVT